MGDGSYTYQIPRYELCNKPNFIDIKVCSLVQCTSSSYAIIFLVGWNLMAQVLKKHCLQNMPPGTVIWNYKIYLEIVFVNLKTYIHTIIPSKMWRNDIHFWKIKVTILIFEMLKKIVKIAKKLRNLLWRFFTSKTLLRCWQINFCVISF